MPGGDQTGPTGMGPMTGRRAGHCAGAGVPGFVNRTFGGFFGRGRGGGGRGGGGQGGGGRGWRNMFHATGLPGWARAGVGAVDQPAAGAAAPNAQTPSAQTPSAETSDAGPQTTTARRELDALKRQAQQAADVLASVQQRIGELEAGAAP